MSEKEACRGRICLHFNLSVSFDSFPEVVSCAGSLLQCPTSLNPTLRYQNALHGSLYMHINGTMDPVDTCRQHRTSRLDELTLSEQRTGL